MLLKKAHILSVESLGYYDAVCFTANGVVKKNGDLVMGAGVAKAFNNQWPKIAGFFGAMVKLQGNKVHYCEQRVGYKNIFVISFPTKHHWRNPSDIELIKQSSSQLMELIDELDLQNVALPKPGCCNGGLRWDDVKNAIEPILDDRVTVVYI